MPFMILTPRELDLLTRPVPASATGENADLVRKIQAAIDTRWKELQISAADAIRVRAALRNWRGGFEPQFQAVISAMERTR